MNRALKPLLIISMVLCAISAALSNAAEPRLKWSFETGGKIYAAPVLSDINHDGKLEVVVAASRDRRILCLDSSGGLLWDCRIEDGNSDGFQATPSALDYDGDGKQEVFFATKGGTVGCIDAQGHIIWRTFTNDKIDYGGLAVADVDGDDRIEVIFGAESGRVYCLDDCGIEKWHYQGDGPVRGIPAVEFDAQTRAPRIFVVFGGGAEACLGGDGKVIWSATEPSARKMRYSTPALGSIDQDPGLDVATVNESFDVIVRDAATGAEKWRWAGKSATDQTNSIALADFDKRNCADIVCADGTGQGGAGHVHRLRDGKALWSVDVGGSVVQGPSIADVDGDGCLEILVCSRSRRLICLDADGKEKWSFPSETEVLTTPSIGDIDGDGIVEIVFTSKDRFVYCLTVDGAYSANLMPWPMISHDPQLSGNQRGVPFAAPAMVSPPSTPDMQLPAAPAVRIGDNVIDVGIDNNSFRPRRFEASVGIRLVNGTWIERRLVRRFEPLERADIRLEYSALYPGEYSLVADLLDVGQGRIIHHEEKSLLLDLNAEFDHEAALALQSKKVLFEEMHGEGARSLLQPACDQSEKDYYASLEELRGLLAQPGATLQQHKEAVGKATHAARQLKRLFARCNAICRTPAEAPDFGVIPEIILRKVFKDEPFAPPFVAGQIERRPAEVSLCRNERETVQIVIVPAMKDLKDLRVSIAADLVRTGGVGTIPVQDITIQRVGYVRIGPPEYNWLVEKQGEYPDVLFPNEPMDVPAMQDAQPFFITVMAREQTPAGDYAGVIRVEADDCRAVEIPLNVRVWDFQIPAKPNFKVSMWMNENWIKAFYKYPERTPFEVRKRFYQMHLDHRISPIHTFPEGGGDMIEDFEYLMANGQNCFFVPVPGYTPEDGRPAAAGKLLATRALLRRKGWDPYVLFYSMDEVAVMARHLIPQMVEMNNWVKTVIPEWPRLETSAPEKDLFGAADVWCPTIDSFDPRILSERMASGDRLWFYTVWGRPGIMIEFPATDHRLMFWECFKYGAEGFLYWGTTHWDFNCEGDQRWPDKPWITYNRQPGHNGCGYLIYPGPGGTPLSSIRLELVRDGIEDYEYLYLLRQMLRAAGAKTPEPLRKQAMAELNIDPEVLVDNMVFTENPAKILHARKRIAELIEQLTTLVAS